MLSAHSRLRGLLDALVGTAREPSLTAALRLVTDTACRLTDARYGALGLLGPDGRIRNLVHVGADADTARQLGRPPTDGDLVGLTLRAGAPLRVDGVAGHPGLAGYLGAPVTLRGVTHGALYLAGKRGGAGFTRDDEDLVAALAAAAGLAVENARRAEDGRRRQSWHTASNEITAALLSVTEPAAALELVARRARQVAGASLAAIAQPQPRSGLIVTAADGPGSDALCGAVLPPEGAAMVEEATRTGRARLLAEDGVPRLLGPAGAGLALATVMVVPLVAAGRPLGGLLLGTPVAAAYSELDLDLAVGLASQAALTLELTRVQRDRERLAVFEDRDRIARDLHDVVIQRLFAAGLRLRGLARSAPGATADGLGAVVGELDASIADIRQTIFSLTSPAPDGLALRAEIDRIAGQAEHSLGIRPTVRVEGAIDVLVPVVVHPHLLAALREALSNIARHSRATRVEVLVRADNDAVLVEVHDDGVGPGGATVTSGLANLRRRAQDLGGQLEFGPGDRGVGTTVRWQVPISGGAASWATASPPGVPRP
ncbi:MAG: GAF domain-containing protein [Frankia sp.]|nr:GAF domain-containing protein [Frankia sp.]